MSFRTLTIAIVLATGVVACDRSSPSPAPATPSPIMDSPNAPATAPALPASSSASSAAAAAAPGHLEKPVNMDDACDPETFNAAIGPGTCLGSGGVTFEIFVKLLQKSGVAGPWHFAPNNTSARVGQTLVAFNRGGETHTFTEVAEFGGGIVPFLNDLSHTPVVAPECQALDPDDFVAPGTAYREEVDETGTVKFQCCIHPWMRLEARVSK
jgi:hypothetical protein